MRGIRKYLSNREKRMLTVSENGEHVARIREGKDIGTSASLTYLVHIGGICWRDQQIWS